MSYIKEIISGEDQILVNLDSLVAKKYYRKNPSSWVIDRDTGNYLVQVFRGTQFDESTNFRNEYIFYWNGNQIDPVCTWSAQSKRPHLINDWGFVNDIYKLSGEPILPIDLENFRSAIYEDFSKAIVAFNFDNAWNTPTQFHAIFPNDIYPVFPY
jgi:hypothetical protein